MIEIQVERRYCNCCHSNVDVKTITFWSDGGKSQSGISVALCKKCRLDTIVTLCTDIKDDYAASAAFVVD